MCNKVYAQKSSVGSRIYFPELYGISIPSASNNAQINSGFIFSSAVEYRLPQSHWFMRFNYDDLNNRYTSNGTTNYSNIIRDRMSNNFLVLGGGYRTHIHDKLAFYGIAQAGMSISGYNKGFETENGIILTPVSNTAPSVKLALGSEYYLFKGFAINIEVSQYNILQRTGFDHSRFHALSLSLGITTTLF
ncbi:outer membrane beta-barrel protein [Mucilaginibacter sp. KACC 22063]|uniref:outer membrane beta-barrel protein n=1 Tax=Mucilaginibacter sp. KACC 22063 TaxID=3025666 RepID=UPI0023671D1A|nr:outer membrane beta-barrel protein [Mucilaginibacter sp. KACC 22063]WDF56946.1 outer membrane beta-barrel protein [Mucilaginibacter sp. KACC 22063]